MGLDAEKVRKQVDEKVRFYANTFGGTVFVTNDGEIVYSLPKTRMIKFANRDAFIIFY